MNKQTLVWIAGMTLAAVVFAARPVAAEANGIDDYRAGMAQLIPVADTWNADLDTVLATLSTKPELACTAEYTDLLFRGESIHADIVGTGENTPRALRASHDRIEQSLARVVAGARSIGQACDGSTLAANLSAVEEGQTDYQRGSARIRNFVHGFRLAQ